MIGKILLPFAVAMAAFALVVSTGCENNNDKGGGNAVGTWKVTSWRDPKPGSGVADNKNTGFTFTFKSDGNFDFRGAPAGTYSTSGNTITGSGKTATGQFDINFTISGNTLEGGFYEHWAKKTVGVTAVKQ